MREKYESLALSDLRELAKVRAKLADGNFTAKVPAKVLDEHRQREVDWTAQFEKLKTMLDALS